MDKKETKRVKVDYAHLDELRKMDCVETVLTEPRIVVEVRTELSPHFPAIARFGDYVETETRRRCPWVQPWMSAGQFGKVFANKQLIPEEGGEE